ncbi:hypothetical protein ACFORH_43325 [Amycolatopsis roodepoortensis]|uniref:DNA gyrase/topoisomerase IV subunit B n=1 Tax=Amycolatopsis roodepoortensis TaxID=700274 RepID=A0ABR9LIB2_9PSEU|nr:hypothetical protein [Amycolatopsis roodepoortensis]MBE1580426.1 DNA gyrase/topoisomerase IV subunit B [Amycolatopsis roodepoortensis]
MTDHMELDVDGWVEKTFPYDGPHSPESVMNAGSAIRELTRYLANATQHKHTVAWAAIARRILANVSATASIQTEVLAHLAEAMDRQAADPTLYHEATPHSERAGKLDQRAVTTVRDATVRIREAKAALAEAQIALDRAVQTIYPLGND